MSRKAFQNAVGVQHRVETAHVDGRQKGLDDSIDQAPGAKDDQVQTVSPRQLPEAPRRQKRQDEKTHYIEDCSIQGVEQREDRVGRGKIMKATMVSRAPSNPEISPVTSPTRWTSRSWVK